MSPSLRCLPESSLFPSLAPHPQPCCWSALANPCCRLEKKSAQAADAKRKKEKEKRCSFACSLTYICMFTDPAGARPSLVGGDFSCRAHALLQPPPPQPGTHIAGASWVEADPELGEGVFLPPRPRSVLAKVAVSTQTSHQRYFKLLCIKVVHGLKTDGTKYIKHSTDKLEP